MHISARINAEKFYNNHCKHLNRNSVVIDFGSYDINGTLRPIFENHKYIGIDMCAGPNVDVVCKNESVPFANESVDVITSSSCFEHDESYWVTFLEMCRILKPGGYIYIQAPSNGRYHACPHDCWRFYADSWKALETWAKKNNYDVTLVESYIDKENSHTDPCLWEDSIGIFKKNSSFNKDCIDLFCKDVVKQVDKWNCYFSKYDKYFSKFKNKEVKILEIGVYKGGSLEMWKKYFGPSAKIVGIDNDPSCKQYEQENVDVLIGNQHDPFFLRSVVDKYKGFDIIIDDGSQQSADQIFSFEFMFDYLNNDGVYLIEDTHTSYWPGRFNGGLKNPKTLVEFSKNLIDDLNGYSQIPQKINKYTNEISDIHYSYGMLFVEKNKIKCTPHDVLIESGRVIRTGIILPKKEVI